MVPGSTFKYGSNFIRLTFSPRLSSRHPIEAAASPLPNEDTTPPVTKMYFADMASSLYFVLGNCAAWRARSIMTENEQEGNVENRLPLRSTSPRPQVIEKAAERIVQPSIPLLPVMASGNDVEFESKLALLEKAGEAVIGGKQAFLFAAGQVEVRRFGGIHGANQHKRVIVAASCAAPRSEDRSVMPILPPAVHGKRATRHIDGRAQTAGKGEHLRMVQGEFDRSITTHRNAQDRPVRATGCRRQSTFDIFNEVVHDVVFVSILRVLRGICVVRLVGLGHDQDQAPLGKARDIRIVRPVAEAATSTVEQVDNRQSRSGGNVRGCDDAVRHVTAKGCAMKGHVLHGNSWRKPRAIGRLLLASPATCARDEHG